jgi:hypothetical protein
VNERASCTSRDELIEVARPFSILEVISGIRATDNILS